MQLSISHFIREKLDYPLCFPLHLFGALPRPVCFTTVQSTVAVSLLFKYIHLHVGFQPKFPVYRPVILFQYPAVLLYAILYDFTIAFIQCPITIKLIN